MNNRFRPLPVFILLAIVAAACASQTGDGGTQPSSSDQVATIVAMTLQALTPEVVAATPEASTSLLPHTFYYLADGSVFRMERDGKTVTQLTFETVNVTGYDVSLVDGSVAYVANNQLLLVNADGSNRRVLVDGGPVSDLSRIYSPVFSPDGQTIAYAHHGLSQYDLSTGQSVLRLGNQWVDTGTEQLYPLELYWPEKYSPDGTKLIVKLGYLEGISMAIYDPVNATMVRLTGKEREDEDFCYTACGGNDIEWLADSSGFYSANSQNDISSAAGGLWKVDAVTGAVTTLISFFDSGDATINFPAEPHLAPNGRLYFFFLNYKESAGYFDRAPLQLVRSAPDGVTGRITLRPDTFELMNEALWAPDASLVVVAFAPTQDVYDGGQAEVVYLDSRPNVVLTTFAQQMKWGP